MEDQAYRAAVEAFMENPIHPLLSEDDKTFYINAFLAGARYGVESAIEKIKGM